jgi:hypothetical protein
MNSNAALCERCAQTCKFNAARAVCADLQIQIWERCAGENVTLKDPLSVKDPYCTQ